MNDWLPRKYRAPFATLPNNSVDGSFKTIDELRAFYNKRKLYKQWKHIKI